MRLPRGRPFIRVVALPLVLSLLVAVTELGLSRRSDGGAPDESHEEARLTAVPGEEPRGGDGHNTGPSVHFTRAHSHSELSSESCKADWEGAWAIGVFRGPSPLNLTPAAQNPIITCASVTSPPSNFVADPFLWRSRDDLWHIFFETKTNTDMQGDIGVAESTDQGATWRYLGLALDEPWHLSYPFIFQWRGQAYMVPESYQAGGLWLYHAVNFPLQWELEAVLMERPLVDASLVEWEGRWWLLAVDEGAQRDLEVFYADSPQGPWQPHALSPMRHSKKGNRIKTARLGGRVIVHNGRLLRFAQDCREMYGHRVKVYQIDVLNPGEYEETEVPFHFGGVSEEGAWNGARHHHVDAQMLPDGTWVAVMDGDRMGKPARH